MRLLRIFYSILFLPLFVFGSVETDVQQINSYTFSILNKQTTIETSVRNIMNDLDAVADRFVQETTARTSFRSNVENALTSIDSKLTDLASPNDYSSQLNKILSILGSSAYTSSQDLSLFKFLFGSQYYVPSNNSLYRGGVYGMISDILQELKNQNSPPNISITNNVQAVFSITNVVNPVFSITNDIHNSIVVTNQMPTIDNVVSNFVSVTITNQQAGLAYDMSIVTNFLLATGFVANKGITEEQLLNYAKQNGFYTAFNLNPFYWASSGLIMPVRTSTVANEKAYINKLKTDVPNWTIFSATLSAGRSIIEQYMPPASDNSYDYLDFMTKSELARETLYGTFDIEQMFKASTNHIAEISKIGPRIDNLEVIISNGFETVVLTLYQFTNLMSNVSVSSLVNSNQFASALQESSDIMPASFTDTTIDSISNATVYATEDNGYSTLLNQNAIDLDSFDYSSFESSVRSFVQVWQNGVNVGSPTLNIHFYGVDTGEGSSTLEQTISLDFELPQSAQDKIGAFWSAVFALIRGSLILWGFFRLFNAVLNANRRESSSGHTDFTNVDVD